MAQIDYTAITKAIASQIRDYSGMPANSSVEHETEIVLAFDACPGVYVYFERRDAVPGEQRLSAGQRTDYQLRFSIWCVQFHLDSVKKAAEYRNTLMAAVELALMSDHTIGGTVHRSWLEGGENMITQENGFLSLGEIILVAVAETSL